MNIFGKTLSLPSSYLRALMLSLPLLTACGSEIVLVELPDAAAAGEPFEVSVEHVFVEDLNPFSFNGDDNEFGALLFAGLVPEGWQAQNATYEGTLNGEPILLSITISNAPPESSPELIELIEDLIEPVPSAEPEEAVESVGPSDEELAIAALIDISPLTPPEGMQVIWFSTNDLPSIYFTEGDGGTLAVEFIASTESASEVSVEFFHGYYSEFQSFEFDNDSPKTPLAAAISKLAAAPVLDAATAGYIGGAFWFLDSAGGTIPGGAIPPHSQGDTMIILPAAAPPPPTVVEPVPVMGGVMLFILSLGVGIVGLSRRYKKG